MALTFFGIINKLKNKKTLSLITIILGCLFVICWTLFRFYTKNVNFDQTGQQLLSRQWLDGSFGGSIMAPTNYIVKMLFMYIPADVVNIDPKAFLIISTIILNIVTFIGIYYFSKKILEYFSIPISTIFNLSMLWLSTVVGSVFWIQFANSRNIEVVAGLGIVYLGLLLNRRYSIKLAICLVVLSGVTFFADPMQLYITAISLLLYTFVNCIFLDKNKIRNLVTIFISILIGYLASILLTIIAKSITHVEFFSVGSLSQSLAIFSQPKIVIIETFKNFLRLIAGTNEMGNWRQVLNIGLVILMALACSKLVIEKKLSKKFIFFIIISILTPIGVYIASGQPVFMTDTSRYLIMIMPAMIICFSSLELCVGVLRKSILATILVVVCVNSASLLYITVKSQRTDLVGEYALRNRYEYLMTNNYKYGYSSMDTAIPAMYLFGKHDGTLLPLSCENNRLRKSTLFYDKSIFKSNESIPVGKVPIILDGNAIGNYPSVCTIDAITAQIGRPLSSGKTLNGDEVLIYKSEVFKKISF